MNEYLASALLMICTWIILKYLDMMVFIPFGVRRESEKLLKDPRKIKERYQLLHQNLIMALQEEAFPEMVGEIVGHFGAVVSDQFKMLTARICNPKVSSLAKASQVGIEELEQRMEISPALQKALGKAKQYAGDIQVLKEIFSKGGDQYG